MCIYICYRTRIACLGIVEKRDARTEGKREKGTKQERECTRKGEEK